MPKPSKTPKNPVAKATTGRRPWSAFGTNEESYNSILLFVHNRVAANMVADGTLNQDGSYQVSSAEFRDSVKTGVDDYLTSLLFELPISQLEYIESGYLDKNPKPFLAKSVSKGKRRELYDAMYPDVLAMFGVR